MITYDDMYLQALEEAMFFYYRTIDGTRCRVLNEADIRSVEWHEPRLRHITDYCKCTQYNGKIYIYTGRRVITVEDDNPWRWKSLSELLRIGKAEIKKIIQDKYTNEVIL